jgi:predicted ATPase
LFGARIAMTEDARDGRQEDGPPPPRQHLPSGQWRVRLLGAFEARNGDISIERVASRAERMLLVKLALNPSRTHQRETLIDLLWPDRDSSAGRRRFSTVLSNLRSMLEPAGMLRESVLRSNGDEVGLAPGSLTSDVAEFEASVRTGNKALARSLYWGHLLPSETHEWVAAERARLQQLFERVAGDDAHVDAAGEADGADEGEPDDEGPTTPRTQSRPIASVAEEAHGIPSYHSSFIGREADVERLLHATQRHRIVTVIGPGGCGKTRLSVEAARRSRGFDIVKAVLLDRCIDAAHVIDHVRAALGLQSGARRVFEQVVDHLEARRALLLLDNLEQLADDAGLRVIVELLEALPGLQVWITSRRALQLPGEYVLALEPLALPAVNASPAQVAQSASGALFVDRARARRADFRVNGRNAAGVAELCRLLDGLPLAIELATAHVRDMSPEAMAAALRVRSLPLERAGSPARRDDRHASLARTIDLSWNLLTNEQRDVLVAVTVFRGSWTEEQAAAVSGQSATSTLQHLHALVQASLVQCTSVGDARRYRLLTSISDRVRDHAQPTVLALCRQRHRALALEMAQAVARTQRAARDDDLPNLVEALVTSMDDGETGRAVDIALQLRTHWGAVGAPAAALEALQAIAADAPPSTPRFSSFLAMLAPLFLLCGLGAEANACAERAVQLAGHDAALLSDALSAKVNTHWRTEQDGAAVADDARRAVALAREARSPLLEARALLQLGPITLNHDANPALARDHFTAAGRILRDLGDVVGDLFSIAGLLACDLAEERFVQGLPLALEAQRQASEMGQVNLEMQFFNRTGMLLEGLKRHDEAVVVYARQAAAAQRHGLAYHFAYAMWNLCYELTEVGRHDDAAHLMAFAAANWQGRIGTLSDSDQHYIAYVRKAAQAALGPARFRACWAKGEKLTAAEALTIAQPPGRAG